MTKKVSLSAEWFAILCVFIGTTLVGLTGALVRQFPGPALWFGFAGVSFIVVALSLPDYVGTWRGHRLYVREHGYHLSRRRFRSIYLLLARRFIQINYVILSDVINQLKTSGQLDVADDQDIIRVYIRVYLMTRGTEESIAAQQAAVYVDE
ncbi:MAG: hypothetical protein Q8P83_02570 [bacterium]|nr:hypothetical protein [bacterium]